ncbi:MAG: hypothetical protein AAF726_22305 [Planctomycetota bacterium]
MLAHSERVRDKDIKPLQDLRERLVGPHFGGGAPDTTVERPTNTAYGFMARYHAEVLGGDLRCIVQADPGSPEEPLALEYEDAVNECYERNNGPRLIELAFTDMCCGYGALIVHPPEASTVKLSDADREKLRLPLGVQKWRENDEREQPAIEDVPATDVDPTMPQIRYLEPGSWFWDRSAYTLDQAEFIAYDTTHDIRELIAEAKEGTNGWRVEELENLQGDLEAARQSRAKGAKRKDMDSERDRVTLRTLICWTAEIEGEERPDHHNAVAYVMWSPTGSPESAIWVKDPAWHFSPPFPQVALFYQHMAGEDSTPFSTLTANKTKIEAADGIHAVAYRKIRDYKRGYAMDARQRGTAEDIEGMTDDQILLVPNMAETGGIEEIVKGGLEAPIVAAIQYLDGLLAEDLGLDSAARGAAQGGGTTATETAIANSQSSTLVRQFAQAFNRGAADLFRIIAWYAGHDSRFVVRVGVQARAADAARKARELFPNDIPENDAPRVGRAIAEQAGGFSQGGDFRELDGLDFNALRFSINAQLQRSLTMEERRILGAQFRADLAQVLQMAAQMPFYDWKDEVRALEEDYGKRGLVANIDFEMLSQFAGTLIEQGSAQADMQFGSPSSETGGGQSGPRMTVMNGPVMGRQESMRRAASQTNE